MGKNKTKKAKVRRNVPTGLPSVEDTEKEAELEENELPMVQLLIEKLQSPCADNKVAAASAIAKLADSPEILSSLLENNIVKIAGPLLTSSNVGIKHCIAGALRNISACGGHEVCQFMVDQDLMTPLVALFKQYSNNWTPIKTEEAKIDSKTDIFLQATHLLWNLCESSGVAVSIFNEQDLLPILLRCLSIETYGIEIPVVVAQCLHIISENNSEVIAELAKPTVLEEVQSLMNLKSQDSNHTLLKTVAAGIVTNVHSGKLNSCPPSTVASVIQVIANILSTAISQDLHELAKEIKILKEEKKNLHRETELIETIVSTINTLTEKLDNLLTAKQIGIEILTNICCSDEGDDGEETSSSDTSEEMMAECEEMATNVKFAVTVPCEIQEAVVSFGFLERILDHVIMIPDDVCLIIQAYHESKDIIKKMHTVKCRALFCAQNIFQILDFDDLGGTAFLFETWIKLTHLAFKQIDSTDLELLEAATGSVRAALQKFAEGNCSAQFQQMTSQDLLVFSSAYQKSSDAGIRVNIVRILGTLGCLLGNPLTEHSIPLVKDIGVSLLEICTKDSELWIIAEALDAIFDVFAEDHLDKIAQEISLVEKLSNLLPVFKGKLKQQRKHCGHLPIISTAKTNLIRFIKYKNEHRKHTKK